MTRTYYIEYRDAFRRPLFDKITYRSIEGRPSWHKVEALNHWKKDHPGFGWLTIRNVRTKNEMQAAGLM